nr:NUDIX hydrolase [uncultured Desulfobulbus sp.]
MNGDLFMYCTELMGEELEDDQKRDGQRAGAYLAYEQVQISRVYYLNHPLYKELAHKLVKAMGCSSHKAQVLNDGDGLSLLVANTGNPILIVGSKKPLRGLVQENLSVVDSEQIKSGLIGLRHKGWKRGQQRWAVCARMQLPELPKLFAFPAPNGPERRKRPAYYYNQSAVVPYKQVGDELKILVIGSSKRKHLVVPKGIHEPGLSSQESAAKESFEEAGATGPVSRKPIGQYSYKKWGAECTVFVYAQRVEALTPEKKWEERHRGRQWMRPEQAAKKVKDPALGAMILRLEHFIQKERV